MTDPESKPPATPRDLWDAVDRLTRPTTIRLLRDDGATERVQVPSLLDQLTEALDGGETGGARGVPSSRPPTDAAALSLLIEIAGTVRDACRERGIKRKLDTDRDLRQLVSAVNRDGDPAVITACTDLVHSWCARIKATISNDPDRTWRMHGAACRVCSSTTIPVWDTDGTETRQPALIVHSTDGRIDRIDCGFCGSTLTGPDLVDIVRRAPRAAESA